MKNIVIIYGGKSCECDISVITALTTFSAIKYDFNVIPVYLYNGRFFTGKDLENIKKYHPFKERNYKEVTFNRGCMIKKGSFRRKKKIDCALICAHGGQGEGGSLSGLLEIAEIPYTCCPPLQSAICMDKIFTKYLLQYFHLPTLPFCVYENGMDVSKLKTPEYPVILKPATLGSSIGITLVSSESELPAGLQKSSMFDKNILIEKALECFREFTCAAIKHEDKIICSEIEEVIAPGHFYSFDEKYKNNETKRIYPANVPITLTNRIYKLTKKIYSSFHLKGVVRIDFLEENGEIFVNEINTVPGSLSWYLFKNLGYDLPDLCGILCEEAIREKEAEKTLFSEFGSTVLTEFFSGKNHSLKGS